MQQSDCLEVKTSSSKTHPKPSTTDVFSPLMLCLQASAHLQSKLFTPREAVAKQRPAEKEGSEDNTRCPAPPEMMPRFLVSQVPARDNAQSLLLPLDLSVGAGDALAAGQERSVVSSPKSSLQFSIMNSTSTFTCTHQGLALKPAA